MLKQLSLIVEEQSEKEDRSVNWKTAVIASLAVIAIMFPWWPPV